MKLKKLFLLFILLVISATSMYYFTKNKHTTTAVISATSSPSSEPTQTVQPSSTPIPVKKDEVSDILISCVGDCTLGTDDKFSYNTLPDKLKNNNNDFSYFLKNVKNILENDDITTANLETTLTTSSEKSDKGDPPYYNFKGDPSYAKILTAGSIEAVNLSNNHIYDYKNKGFTDTITSLKASNINYFGEGNKYITTIKGIKIGFLGYTGFSDDNIFLSKVKKDISTLKADGCYIIINFHWGVENSYSPIEAQTHIAHFSIDNGADLIIGHHPHVIEGLETYKGKIICYSLGNFCFGGNQNPADKDTFIFQIKLNFVNDTFKTSGIKVIPCSISSVTYENDYCPTPMKGNNKINLLSKITKLSPNLNLQLGDDFSNVTSK